MQQYYWLKGERQRELRFGKSARCHVCGWWEQSALVRYRGQVLCYECMLRQRGRSVIEQHHVYGRVRPETVPLPGNLHRLVSAYQLEVDHPIILLALFLITYTDCFRKEWPW